MLGRLPKSWLKILQSLTLIPAERYIIDAFQIIVKTFIVPSSNLKNRLCSRKNFFKKKNLILIAVTEQTVLY